MGSSGKSDEAIDAYGDRAEGLASMLGPDELKEALAILRGVLVPGGTMLLSFFTGPRIEAFDHPAATAHR